MSWLGLSIDKPPMITLKRKLCGAFPEGGIDFHGDSPKNRSLRGGRRCIHCFLEVLMLTVKNSVRFVVAGVLAASMFVVTGGEATARPKYKDVLNSTYPDLAKKHGTDGKLTCAVCHPDKDKKKRNNFGVALAGKLAKKNESDEAKIKEALTKAEGEKSKTEGKTFGDLIKAGDLPGTNEVAE